MKPIGWHLALKSLFSRLSLRQSDGGLLWAGFFCLGVDRDLVGLVLPGTGEDSNAVLLAASATWDLLWFPVASVWRL